MSAPPANLFGLVDWYRTIRDQIQHEDNLIVQRLSWLMAAQSFLFTGYAIIANATPFGNWVQECKKARAVCVRYGWPLGASQELLKCAHNTIALALMLTVIFRPTQKAIVIICCPIPQANFLD